MNKLSRYLTRKKIDDYRQIEGWLTPDEALGLYTMARMLPKKSIVVEIGSWQGKSTYCIASGLRSGKVYAIDPFNADGGFDTVSGDDYVKVKGSKDLLKTFTENMQKFGVAEKIITRKGYSADFPAEFKEIDFLFIDGDHSVPGCKNDFELYSGKVKTGGYIAFHDYYHDRPELGPTHVVDNIILKSKEFKFHQRFDSLWVGVKA